jgi:hypothetical protein
MNSRNAIHEELKELSSSLPYDKQPVFTVPQGYFENFAASVWSRINSQHPMDSADELAELSPMLAAIPRKMPFSVPENYFSELTDRLPAMTSEDDQFSEALQQHHRQMPYTVPAGYFEGMADSVLAKVKVKKPVGKVVSFGMRPWMRIAAAAVITGLIILSGIAYFGNNTKSIDPNSQPDEWISQKLKNITSKELDEFIRTVDNSFSSKELAASAKGEAEVRKMLKDVTNSELDAFLNQLPADIEEPVTIN